MKNAFQYKITTVVLVILVAWFGLLAFGTWRARQVTQRQVDELEAKVSGIEKENNRLETLRGQYSNPDYLDKEARAQLNYKAEGEIEVLVYTDDKKAGETTVEQSIPNWQKWLAWLAKKLKI